MASVYSARFVRAASFSGPPVVFFTVPAGFVAVVREISIVVGTNVSVVEAWIEDDEGGRLAVLAQDGTPPFSPTGLQLEGRWTYLTGETLAPATNGITADFHAAGYLLALP